MSPPPPPPPVLSLNEGNLFLASQAIKANASFTYRAAAKAYSMPKSTLNYRNRGRAARRDTLLNCQGLTLLEGKTIIDHILDLDARGFPPSKALVRDMADKLRAERQKAPVGKNWVDRFVNRSGQLRTRWTRSYDDQRKKQEDPEVISAWFKLVADVKAKYGIQNENTYNFDKSGFMMGAIGSQPVITASERREKLKHVQPGDHEWVTMIHGISAGGWAIPPFIIYAGKVHVSTWHEDTTIPGDWVIAVSDNG